MVDTLRALMLDRTIENVPQIWNTVAMASVISSCPPWCQAEDPIPDEVIDRMGRVGIGRWLMRFALYGDEEVVDHRFAQGQGGLQRIGLRGLGRQVGPENMAGLEHPFDRVQAGVPNLGPEPDDGLVRRRRGWPHRLLPGRPPDREGRGRESAISSGGWSGRRRFSTTRR